MAGVVVGARDYSSRYLGRSLHHAGASAPHQPGFAATDAAGEFSLAYERGRHDLVVVVYDRVRRELARSLQHDDVEAATFPLPDIQVPARAAAGWLVGAGQPPHQVLHGNDVRFLVDNRDAFQAVIDAVEAARRSINMLLFYLDVGDVFLTFTPDPPVPGGGPVQGKRFEEALAARGAAGVEVRLCCNSVTHKLIDSDKAEQVEEYFEGRPRVTVRRFDTPQYTPIHAKVLVVDDEVAFSIGSPFVADYWDDSAHRIEDPRHGPLEWWPCGRNQWIQVPVHDVSLMVRGPAVGALNETFRLHWNHVRGTAPELAQVTAPPAQPGTVTSVQQTRSLFGNDRFSALPRGEATILEAYLRAIDQAQDYLYLENQYVTSREVVDALILALKHKPALEVIVVMNGSVDIPGYRDFQRSELVRLLGALTVAERERFGLFTLWSHEAPAASGTKTRVLRNYVHSKVAIADDTWAIVGSANLDGTSLSYADHVWRWPLATWMLDVQRDDIGPNYEEARGTEVCMVVLEGHGGAPTTGRVRDLRRRLWAEHLGFTGGDGTPNAAASELTNRPSPGWLRGLWKPRADAKETALKAATPTVSPARVLRVPFSAGAAGVEVPKIWNSDAYLKALGVTLAKVELKSEYRGFSFRKGNWEDA